ncbi:MAG: VPA1269 family protein, partial [Planctomycetota bacterium]
RNPLEKRDGYLEHKAQSSLGILSLYLNSIVMPNNEIPFPTSIENLSKRGFIDGDPGCQNYIQYLRENHSSTAKQYIGELRKAFKYIYEQGIKTNVSIKLDWQFKYREPTKHLNKTPRIPLPIRIINMMRQTLLPPIELNGNNDVVFNYEDFKSTYLEEMRDDDNFYNFLFISRAFNNETEQFDENVFCPLIPSLFYLLLTFPLRPIQARWLDSGELDEFIFSFEKQKMIKNENGIPGRQMGCIQMISDPYSGTEFPGLFINTNKTSYYRSDGRQSGYEIPYMPTELQHIFRYCKEWNSIYSTPMGADNYEIDLFVNETTWAQKIRFGHVKMPKITPIFRNTCSYRHLERSNPVSHNRLYDFYTEVLRKVDRKLKRTNDNTIKLIDDETGKPNQKIDLYTLRVSGITNLFRANVPIEVISEFVAGHATFLMTLHYTKLSAYEVRNILQRAQESFLNESSTSELYERPELDIDNFAASFLHSNVIDLERVYDNYLSSYYAGIVDVRIDGLCLASKNCNQGKPRTVIHNNNVGHENCTQCQFWLTGPQFLTGQVLKCNQLMQKMISHADEIVELRRSENSLLGKEGSPATKYSSIAGHLEQFEYCLHKMAEEWEERYQLILASYNLKYNADNSEQLISTDSANNIHLNIKKAHDLEYLNLMSAAAEIYPEFKVERYDIKLEHIISRILAASSNELDTSLFLCLDDETRKEAAFAFSEMILNMLHSDDQNQQVANIEKAIGEGLPMEMIPKIAQQLSVFSQSSKAKKGLDSNGHLAIE